MDKRRIIEIIANAYKTLTPIKTSVFLKNEEVIHIRVVSNAFQGMTFSSRFKLLNDLLKSHDTDLFEKYLFIFEAFTLDETQKLPKNQLDIPNSDDEDFKNSASSII